MARHWSDWAALLLVAYVAVWAGARARAQEPNSTEIDELIKQCNEQMNVQGQFERAAELAARALDLSLKAGDRLRASTAMVYLGAAYAYQGRLTEALDVSERNLTLAREINDKKALEQALNTVAGVLGELGRYEESLSYLYECLEVARETNDATMQYMSLLNIGEAYVRSGDPDEAEAPLQESLRAARGLTRSDTLREPSKKATEMALLNLGSMEVARERYPAALSYYERVYASRPESPLWMVTALEGMANVHEKLGRPQRAIDLLQEAMPIAEKSASGLQYARLTSHLGTNQELLGQLDDALRSQNRALALLHEKGGNPDYEWQVEFRIGHVQRALKRSAEALEHYQKSIDGIEHLRATALNTEEGRAGVLAKSRDVYAETANLLYELHQAHEALAIAERGRARAFLDILAESRIGLINELTTEQRKRESTILERISAAQRRLWTENTTTVKKTQEAELASAEADLEALRAEIRRSNPRYASIEYPEPISLGQIQSSLLDERTVLVEYLLGEQQSLAWVVTKTMVDVVVLPPRKEIEEQVIAYRKVLSAPVSALTVQRSLAEVRRLGAKLYQSILQPVETLIGSAQTLIVVPDGGLEYLPFEALIVASSRVSSGDIHVSYLAEKTSVVYGPSASALVAVQAMYREPATPSKMLLAFGDPVTGVSPAPARRYTERGFSLARLPYARDEVLAIGTLFPAPLRRVLLGKEALEETVKREQLDSYRYIHFASHGFMDESKPARSGILLSRAPQSTEDGILQLDEIMRLKMRADLVTLSACSTGLGKLVNGEGILGLTRAMFYAGARNVTVSLWNVNDPATATLMQSFYGGMTHGLPKHEAMRQAKLGLLRGPRPLWRHPYFWAAFIIEGEGR